MKGQTAGIRHYADPKAVGGLLETACQRASRQPPPSSMGALDRCATAFAGGGWSSGAAKPGPFQAELSMADAD